MNLFHNFLFLFFTSFFFFSLALSLFQILFHPLSFLWDRSSFLLLLYFQFPRPVLVFIESVLSKTLFWHAPAILQTMLDTAENQQPKSAGECRNRGTAHSMPYMAWSLTTFTQFRGPGPASSWGKKQQTWEAGLNMEICGDLWGSVGIWGSVGSVGIHQHWDPDTLGKSPALTGQTHDVGISFLLKLRFFKV